MILAALLPALTLGFFLELPSNPGFRKRPPGRVQFVVPSRESPDTSL